ncbi:MAG TPA: diguanylate cyclase [Geobacteraceae bacterium]|nr:diguanylate cyclase [Geobacteraceae bacterium]
MLPGIWPKPFKHMDHIKLFLISLCVVLSLIIATIFSLLYARTGTVMLQRAREQAATYADLINHAKIWNFGYGGVYVEKKEGVESNIYLRQLGIAPDVKAEGGRSFSLRNHAIMIKEISRYSELQDGVKFRIISRKPMDPANTPDPFEKEALTSLEAGAGNYYRLFHQPSSSPVFRYLVPLYADKTCLECHRTEGYRDGSVIGAISISLPATRLLQETSSTRLLLVLASLAAIGSLIGVTYFFTWRLAIKLDDVQHSLKKLATTDSLTELKNRRSIMDRLEEEFQRARRLEEPLSLIMIDIDHFKTINDRFGHIFGDLVLKTVAALMKGALRSYDIIGRIGGEEFLIISPASSREDSAALAERLLNRIRHEIISDGSAEAAITVSAGVAMLTDGDDAPGMLLKRADAAMYQAKEKGRNRVVIL